MKDMHMIESNKNKAILQKAQEWGEMKRMFESMRIHFNGDEAVPWTAETAGAFLQKLTRHGIPSAPHILWHTADGSLEGWRTESYDGFSVVERYAKPADDDTEELDGWQITSIEVSIIPF